LGHEKNFNIFKVNSNQWRLIRRCQSAYEQAEQKKREAEK
jgi:hypothetical protein